MKKQLKQNGTIEIELVLKSKIVFVIFSSFLAHIKKPITNCNWLFYLYKKFSYSASATTSFTSGIILFIMPSIPAFKVIILLGQPLQLPCKARFTMPSL